MHISGNYINFKKCCETKMLISKHRSGADVSYKPDARPLLFSASGNLPRCNTYAKYLQNFVKKSTLA